MTTIVRTVAAVATLLLTLACGAPQGSPTPMPSPSPSPSPAPVTQVGSAAQAAALVFASDRRFAQMQPLRSDMIGQSSWFEATDDVDGDGYLVTITVGAGDCQAGCIQRHVWTYNVGEDGSIELVSEEGDDINITPAPGRPDPITLHAVLASGPTCPVVTNPPDPACADRPVVNATVFVFNTNGDEVAQGTTGADGSITLQLPPGAYYVAPQMVPDFMGQAAAQAFSANGGDQVSLLFSYDTGIR